MLHATVLHFYFILFLLFQVSIHFIFLYTANFICNTLHGKFNLHLFYICVLYLVFKNLQLVLFYIFALRNKKIAVDIHLSINIHRLMLESCILIQRTHVAHKNNKRIHYFLLQRYCIVTYAFDESRKTYRNRVTRGINFSLH